MFVAAFSFPVLILIVLAAGLLTALAELLRHTSGIHAGVALATLLVGIGSVSFSRQGSTSSARSLTCCLVGLGMLALLTGATPGTLTSAVCWTGLSAAGLLGFTLLQHAKPSRAGGLSEPDSAQDERPLVVAHPRFQSPLEKSRPDQGNGPATPLGLVPVEDSDELADADELDDESLAATCEQTMQTWSRIHSPEEERLEGMVVVELLPGQKHAYVHVPFVPLLAGQLSGYCECESADDLVAELDTLMPYGARISVRRRDARHSARVQVLLAVAAPRLQRAA